MEKDDLTTLFADYNPELSSDALFMSRLTHNMQSVELVKKQMELTQHKNRLATAIAAVTGLTTGILGTLCYPYLLIAFRNIATAGNSFAEALSGYENLYAWIVLGVIVLAMTYFAYDITIIATRIRMSRQAIHIPH